MTRRTALLFLLGLSGLALYLWPAFSAPVVLWSDSALDVAWAREGVGIVSPVPAPAAGAAAPIHPAKPAYLLFLRAVLAAAPSGHETRAIVVVQSLLLLLSIAGASIFIGRRRGAGTGVALYVLLVFFLRLRDSASAVMSEAPAAALLLPITALLVAPPRRLAGVFPLGLSIACLFWVRPNVGAIALLLGMVVLGFSPRRRSLAPLLAGFLLLAAPVWVLTRPRGGGEPLRGLSHAFVFASADYYWNPSGLARAFGAADNWKALLSRGGPDTRRQLVWRALHGLFGTEFYDARWSGPYWRLTTASRLMAPFLLMASIALLFAFPFSREEKSLNAAGPALLFALLAQNLALGSIPRLVLPILPALLLLSAAAIEPLARAGRRRGVAAAAVFGALVAFVWTHPYVLDWEWGRIESAGVTIRQRIPRGSLPKRGPATLHVRIAPPVLPSAAHLELRGPENRLLYTSVSDPGRRKPAITVPLPGWLLEKNASGAVEIEMVSIGSYGDSQSLLFPVIPRPWRAPARRQGNPMLSPSTGIADGSLDWWAHAGAE